MSRRSFSTSGAFCAACGPGCECDHGDGPDDDGDALALDAEAETALQRALAEAEDPEAAEALAETLARVERAGDLPDDDVAGYTETVGALCHMGAHEARDGAGGTAEGTGSDGDDDGHSHVGALWALQAERDAEGDGSTDVPVFAPDVD